MDLFDWVIGGGAILVVLVAIALPLWSIHWRSAAWACRWLDYHPDRKVLARPTDPRDLFEYGVCWRCGERVLRMRGGEWRCGERVLRVRGGEWQRCDDDVVPEWVAPWRR